MLAPLPPPSPGVPPSVGLRWWSLVPCERLVVAQRKCRRRRSEERPRSAADRPTAEGAPCQGALPCLLWLVLSPAALLLGVRPLARSLFSAACACRPTTSADASSARRADRTRTIDASSTSITPLSAAAGSRTRRVGPAPSSARYQAHLRTPLPPQSQGAMESSNKLAAKPLARCRYSHPRHVLTTWASRARTSTCGASVSSSSTTASTSAMA